MKRLKSTARDLVFAMIGFLFYYSGGFLLYRLLFLRNRLLVLFYHEVDDNKLVLGELAVPVRRFERQVQFLNRYFNPISLDQLENFISHGVKLPGYPVLITFDGGYKGTLKNAYPILEKTGTPATVYIVTGSVDTGEVPWTAKLNYLFRVAEPSIRQIESRLQLKNLIEDLKLGSLKELKSELYPLSPGERDIIISELAEKLGVDLSPTSHAFLSWDDVKYLSSTGIIQVGSHTVSHPRLSEISLLEAGTEIRDSKSIIEERISKEVRSFCYPDGHVNASLKDLLKTAGYTNALVTRNGYNSVTSITDPYAIRRIGSIDAPVYYLASKISLLFHRLNRLFA